MEIRASYALVGLFTLLAVLGLVGFTIWSAAKTNRTDVSTYEVVFYGSVSGLSVSNDVLFNGVRVGQVRRITLNPDNPAQVNVLIEIASDTPVRSNSIAKLEMRGMTGLAVVSISGGSTDSPLVAVDSKGKVPVIQTSASPLEAFLDSAPDLINSANQAMHSLQQILGEQNQEAISKILTSTAKLVAALADRSKSVDTILDNVDRLSKELNQLATSLNKLSSTEFKDTVVELHKLTKRLNGIVDNAEPGITSFARDGLNDARRALAEARILLGTLNRVALKLESDPSRFFFGSTLPEYSVKR